MRILFFAPRKCWPLNSGARLRDYYLARQLAQNAALTYLALCYPEEEQFAGEDVGLPPPEKIFERVLTVPAARSYGAANIVRGFFGSTPVTVLNWTNREFAATLARLGGEMTFDAVHLVGVHLVEYVRVLREFPGRPPILCDWHDIQSEKMRRYSATVRDLPRRLYGRRTAALLERKERELLLSCEAHTVVSARDRDKLLAVAPGARLDIIENGVDASYFLPRNAAEGANRVLFVGAMDYQANVDAVTAFALKAWPRIRERFPELRFQIVGRKPSERVLALGAEPGIEVVGTVADVRPFYRDSLCVVVPLLWGSGTRLKIVEAMAAGVPVVSTTIGAEGLEAIPGEELLIADSPEETLAAITALRGDSALRQKLAERGRQRVASTYDWTIPGDRLIAIYKTVLSESNT